MCPEGWTTYNGTCFQINAHPEQRKTWLQADAACRSFEGANLVSIHNTAIKKKLTAEFHKVGVFYRCTSALNGNFCVVE